MRTNKTQSPESSSVLEMHPVGAQESIVVPVPSSPVTTSTMTKTTTMTFVRSNLGKDNPCDADCAILPSKMGRDRTSTRSGWL